MIKLEENNLFSKCEIYFNLVEDLMKYAINHWKVESMHWILDVNFREDDCPVKSENTQRILNVMRKLSIKLHTDYIEKTKPKGKTIISNIRACLTNNQKFEIFFNTSFKK